MCLMPSKNSNLENKNLESSKYISDVTEDILLDNSCDPDSNTATQNTICNTSEIL